jgi:hypothetical protein
MPYLSKEVCEGGFFRGLDPVFQFLFTIFAQLPLLENQKWDPGNILPAYGC